MKHPRRKRGKKKLSLDRISSLPPSIIDTILYLLPIKDAVRTSILSREWRYNWTNIPVLRFRFDDFFVSETGTDALSILVQTYDLPQEALGMINDHHYIDAMKQCFLLHKGPLLEFSLLALEQTVEFDQLIGHLSMKNTLQMLSIEMLNEDSLPLSIFSMQQLTKLSLRIFCINHYSNIKGFKNLTNLYLRDVKISTKTLLHIVSSCPLLKSFTLFIHDILGNDKSSISDLIECLPIIERLIIHTGVYDRFYFDSLPPREQLISLVHLKYLHIDDMCSYYSDDLPMFFHLIRSSPNLETVSLHVCDLTYSETPITFKNYSNIWLKNLSELKIFGQFEIELNLEFVQLLLAKSPMLKKVSIYTRTYDDVSKLSRLLLDSPCASGSIEIIVEYSDDVSMLWGLKNSPELTSMLYR
ncbi:F-box/FBD/LRR-repeat protein At1g13570-like [Rutidosis leptorrhynchoides]|uniref:F-box/FBD/LRR-repeat protein At1g13570-like n=1 Tax=Rutidosis leptorrhynchoides TaxID=125765 RepID=UPI003A9A478C